MKLLNPALWVLQVLISVLFILSGCMKMGMPIEKLAAMYPWTGQLPVAFVRSMGVIDLLGGIGVLLPAVSGKSAIAIVLLMLSACVFHISRGESQVIGFNIVVGILAGIIAWGRLAR